MRSLPTGRFAPSTRDQGCPDELAPKGIVSGFASARLAFTHPPPYIPSLHRHYPASTLLWMF